MAVRNLCRSLVTVSSWPGPRVPQPLLHVACANSALLYSMDLCWTVDGQMAPPPSAAGPEERQQTAGERRQASNSS